MRITARKQKSETGLRSVGQCPRGFEICIDGKRVASVSAFSVGWMEWKGWYFSAVENKELGIEFRNTASEKRYTTKEEARDACLEYIRSQVKKE